MTFADNLVRLRREKGFSQEQLADLMDVSRPAVSKWEAGARRYGAGGDGRTDGVCAGGRDGKRCSRL